MKKPDEESSSSSTARQESREVVDRVLRDAEESAVFGSDSNDESDTSVEDWSTSNEHEKDIYGRGRFDR